MPELDKLVKINLDKERHLRLTLKGMLEFEKATGINLLKGFDLSKLNLEDSAKLLWASLIHEDKELTIDDILCMIDISNLTVAMEALIECIGQSMPDVETDAQKVEVDDRPLVEKSQPG